MIATSGESIWLALGLTLFASLILGCGLPTTAAYVVLATMAVPASEIIQIVITSIIGVTAFAVGLQGFALVECTWPERIFALAAGILLIEPSLDFHGTGND